MEEIAQMIRLEELAQLLLQWSNATNMAVMLVDDQGNEIIESTYQSSYCQLIHQYDHESCKKCWLNHQDGDFVCPAGFHNFSFSFYLPKVKRKVKRNKDFLCGAKQKYSLSLQIRHID